MITLIFIFVCSIILVYLYHTRNFKYWESRGVKHEKPIIFFGNNVKGYLMQQSKTQSAAEMYWKYPKEKVVGFYRAAQPELIIRDPMIAKKIMVSDFANFIYRGFNPNRKVVEPLLNGLFSAEGDLWRMLRTRMTPAFTSAKLKAMFPLIIERAEKLQMRTLEAAKSGESMDSRELMARYTTDFIGACAFGLDSDSLSEEDSDFRKLGKKIFDAGIKDFFINLLKEMYPHAFGYLKYFKKIEDGARELVHEIKRARDFKPCGRNDFLDMMLDIENKGAVEFESVEKVSSDGIPERVEMSLTGDVFMAQIMVFFAAGFETSSNSTSMALHLLAYYPEEQRKVQEDIDKALAKHNNKLSYDSIRDMLYLEMAFKEAMRILPALGYVSRLCSRTYTFEDIDLTIDKEVKVVIPIQAYHMDPKYWDSPNEFRPERFLPENLEKIKDVYMPFGNGPRNCIGARLGLMQSLAGLAAILSKFTVKPAPESKRYPTVDPLSEIVQGVVGGLPLSFDERKTTYLN
ncbi:cytochrome P450 6B2-like [Plodia interpunctella]|uniref:cytochrome P450 6B2-like n=1 Tax=Plodia interpunctella TaxID=58824 RepID=UPI0023688210|nr:cytochrome P450 6B2-like [Plodia interpunctella]